MSHLEQLQQRLAENHGIITTQEVKELGIPTSYLSRLVQEGKLVRLQRGLYGESEDLYDWYYFFQQRNKAAIFSFFNALELHRLTEVIPQEIEVTVYHGYNASHIDKKDVVIHYVNKEIYELGITEATTMFGYKVRVYDMERCICDLIKHRDQIDAEQYGKSIMRYFKRKDKNVNNLVKYAEKMGIEKHLREILDILYEYH